MKHLTVLFVAVLVLTACGPAEVPGTPPNFPVENPPGGITPVEPIELPFAPKPSDATLSRGEAFISEAGLLIRESFPPQIALTLSGDLPTPCHELRVVVGQPDADNRIDVEAYSVVDPEMICTQVLESFQENIELGTFPGGHYTVWVNGERAGEFDL